VWIVTVRPDDEVVHDARSGQPVHCAAKSASTEPVGAENPVRPAQASQLRIMAVSASPMVGAVTSDAARGRCPRDGWERWAYGRIRSSCFLVVHLSRVQIHESARRHGVA
jgi:hypothetical protein